MPDKKSKQKQSRKTGSHNSSQQTGTMKTAGQADSQSGRKTRSAGGGGK